MPDTMTFTVDTRNLLGRVLSHLNLHTVTLLPRNAAITIYLLVPETI